MKRYLFNLILLIISFSYVSCSRVEDADEINNAPDEVWFKQTDLALGQQIKMISNDLGYAISRGKGEEGSGEKGNALIFKDGKWTSFDNFPYSDFPIIERRNDQIWYVIHEPSNGDYKPHLYSYKKDEINEITLPKVMWDETDYSMWLSLSFMPSRNAFMVGQKGNIIFYNGKEWSVYESPVKDNEATNVLKGDLQDVFMVNDSLGWAVGKNGVILKYSNKHWRTYDSPTSVQLNKVEFVNEDTGFIVGETGTILKYYKGLWQQVESGFRTNFYSLKIVNEKKVYIVGARSSLIIYKDGEIIRNQGISTFEDDFKDIDIISQNNKDNIWIIGNNGIYTNSQSLNFSFTNITSQASLRNEGVGGIFFDQNDDEYPELFLLSEDGPNILYENLRNNSFSEVQTFIDTELENFESQFSAIGDVNNDNYTDILEVMDDININLFFGKDDFDFTSKQKADYLDLDLIQSDEPYSISAKFIDFDNDGNLDLYVSNYNYEDMLFKNDGTGDFKNVYENSGISKFLNHRSYGPVFSDFNNDGFIDFVITYRAAEKGKHISLFLNQGGFKFIEKDDSTFYASISPNTFSAIAADFNNDAFTDILIFNSSEKLKLLINDGNASFSDLADSVGFSKKIFHPEPVNGIVAAEDINNDGWLDLFLGSELYLNSPQFFFSEVSKDVGINFTGNPSFGDIDNDGDMDLFIGSSKHALGDGNRAALFRNNLINTNYIKVKLNTDESNRSAIGTKIFLTGFDKDGNEKYKTVREVGLGSSPMLLNDFSSINFGVDTSLVYLIEVVFPSSVEKKMEIERFNRTYEITESSFPIHDLVLAGKSVERTLLIVDWKIELIKLIIFIVIISLFINNSRKTKANQYLNNWYVVPAFILYYFFIIHITIDLNLYISSAVSFILPSVTFFVLSKLAAQYVDKKESKYISHYKLVEIIGMGGMGKVFKAIDTHTGNIVALKIINPTLLKDEENRRRLNSEGRLLSSLEHENIVKVYEFGETEKHSYIAMEYLTGGTLEEFIEENYPIGEDTFKKISLGICEGLISIHTNNVLHRDLKSQNIMLDDKRIVRIMDFGLSKSPLVSTMTSLGTVLGTLGYVAPEQVTNIEVDQRTDIFSCGVILYQMLTNKLPFTGENEMALIHSIFNTVPQQPSQINNSIKKEIDNIVMRCVEKEPDKRYNSASEIKVDLLKL